MVRPSRSRTSAMRSGRIGPDRTESSYPWGFALGASPANSGALPVIDGTAWVMVGVLGGVVIDTNVVLAVVDSDGSASTPPHSAASATTALPPMMPTATLTLLPDVFAGL